MKLGIPNILPLIGFTFFGAISISMSILFFDKVDSATTGSTIFFALFLLMCFGMFGILCYRFKIVVMTDKKLIIIIPFRFQFKTFTFENIKSLKWDLWETFKMGDYRKLSIQTNSGYLTNISDLEFINYDSLEKWLMKKTTLELNLDRKFYNEVQQAKWNKWVNIIVILLVGFFMLLFATGNNFNFIVPLFLAIIIWRLIVKLVQYQQRINESRQRREDWRRKTSR
ncbi:hypothetical protein [Fulvivirga lutea]|uniref:Uncharacterized protein n=1 Tax=Fulvivirga lutea TaxID=2810512 RepID=A0A975A174_9BACT|nr:hypothetical protein [Fulvivirga lutea]QSE97227.1 hypothetical protein JR347_16795 [Fulvivirga lutea]